MLVHYLTLGLKPGATDAQIRQRYLELTRQYPPGRDAERFRRIAAAYEALADARTRMDVALFGASNVHLPRETLHDWLVAASQRHTPGLQNLLEAEGWLDE